MRIIRYFAKNISLLNVLLAVVIGVILIYALSPLFSAKVAYKPAAGKGGQEVIPEKALPHQAPSPADYTVVAENNVFHPDRRIPPEKKEEKQLPKPDLTLYGTLITTDLSVAYVEDKQAPYTTLGRGRRPRVLKKGDVIGGFVLKEIETNRITLVRNEEVMTVSLDTVKARADQAGRGPAASPLPTGAAPLPGPRAGVAPLPEPRTVGRSFPSQRTLMPPGGAPLVPAPVTPGMSPPQQQIRTPGSR